MVGRWTCNPEVPGSNPPPFHWMDLSSVASNSNPPRFVNIQLVSLPPVGIFNLLCLISILFVCYAHFIIFTWNLRDINVNYFLFFSLILHELELPIYLSQNVTTAKDRDGGNFLTRCNEHLCRAQCCRDVFGSRLFVIKL